MDFKKISDLTELLTLLDDDVFAVDRSGALRKVTNANLRAAIINQILAALPDEDINWTGDNTHAGDEEFNGDVEFTGEVDLSNATLTPKIWDSAALSASTVQTFAHGESKVPTILEITLLCVTGEGGYSTDDEASFYASTYAYNRTVEYAKDGTNIKVFTSSSSPVISNKTTTTPYVITFANWKVRIRYI